MKCKIIFIIIFTMHSAIIFAQKHNAAPLYKFLKTNADSTIVMSYESAWEIDPAYYMLSKKGDTLSAYTYKARYNVDQRSIIPHNLRYRLYQNTQVPADVNSYFSAKYLSVDSLKNFWKELITLQPWHIDGDKINEAGCPIYKDSLQRQIRDASFIKLHLITKKRIKELSFYAPEYYENKICPSSAGRQAILKIEKLFVTYIGK